MTRTTLGRAHLSHRMSSQPYQPPARSTRDAGTLCVSPSETTLYEVVHCGTSTARVRIVVVARQGAHDGVERGDDHDDAWQCRSDARPRPRPPCRFCSGRARLSHGGRGRCRHRERAREKSFRKVRICISPKWKPPVAASVYCTGRSRKVHTCVPPPLVASTFGTAVRL